MALERWIATAPVLVFPTETVTIFGLALGKSCAIPQVSVRRDDASGNATLSDLWWDRDSVTAVIGALPAELMDFAQERMA